MSEQNENETALKAEELQVKEMEITESELMDNDAIEQAYKAQMLTEVPDLWNRIEAALPETTPSEMFHKKEDCEKKQGKIDYKVVIFRYGKRVALIAAGICILLMVPTLLSISRGSMMSTDAEYSEAEEGVAYAVAPETTEEAPAEEVPMDEEAMEKAAVEAPAMATAETEAPAMEEETSTADIAQNKNVQETSEDTVSVTDMTNGSEESKQAEKKRDFTDGALYTEGVRIEVISQDNTKAMDDDGNYLFSVMILEDASGMYTVNDVCEVYADEALSKEMKSGSKHTVTIVNLQPASSSQLELYLLDEATIDNP